MPELPRGLCDECGAIVPVRVNGTARQHRPPSPPLRIGVRTSEWGWCAGTGKPVQTTPEGKPIEVVQP